MNLTPTKISQIITLHEHTSLTHGETAEQCEVSSGAVNKIIKIKMRLVQFHLKGRDDVGKKGKQPLKMFFSAEAKQNRAS
jgi:DNA-directed RNA polymerase specialized sigma24 family protein